MNDKREYIIDFIRENQNDMYRFAYSYVKNREDALDIIQESVVKAISSSKSLKDISRIKPWIFKIIVNEAYKLFKSSRIYTDDTGIDVMEYESYTDNLTEYIDKQAVLKEVMDLDEKYRIIIVLRYFEDMQIKEIGSILNIIQSMVKSRLYKALYVLKKRLGEDYL